MNIEHRTSNIEHVSRHSIAKPDRMKNIKDAESKSLTWLKDFAKSLYEQKFFGKIILTYQNGKITDAYKGEKIKPLKTK